MTFRLICGTDGLKEHEIDQVSMYVSYVCMYVCVCVCTNVCMYVCMYVCTYTQVQQLLKKLFILSDYQNMMRGANSTDCSILYWHKELLMTCLDDVYQHPSEASR